jgi:hypothetical protein
MTTVVSTPNTEVTTPTSYISRWIAQSHGNYQKKANEYYSSSSSLDYRTSTIQSPIKNHHSNSHITTWQAQAKSRLNTTTNITSNLSVNDYPNNNNQLQEKLNRIR